MTMSMLQPCFTSVYNRIWLTSGIITQSSARLAHFKRYSESGCLMVNLPTADTDCHVPFGGKKSFSNGSREHDKYAVEFLHCC
jgi:acyl-CoA reductase-like NAD-dependent aldehyde dehydrogenase